MSLGRVFHRCRAGLPIMHLMHVHGAPGGRGPPEWAQEDTTKNGQYQNKKELACGKKFMTTPPLRSLTLARRKNDDKCANAQLEERKQGPP